MAVMVVLLELTLRHLRMEWSRHVFLAPGRWWQLVLHPARSFHPLHRFPRHFWRRSRWLLSSQHSRVPSEHPRPSRPVHGCCNSAREELVSATRDGMVIIPCTLQQLHPMTRPMPSRPRFLRETLLCLCFDGSLKMVEEVEEQLSALVPRRNDHYCRNKRWTGDKASAKVISKIARMTVTVPI